MTVQQAFDLSRDWYRGRLDIGWVPPTPAEAEATFARAGLEGAFWSLT